MAAHDIEFYRFTTKGWRKVDDVNILQNILDPLFRGISSSKVMINSIECEINFSEYILIDDVNLERYSIAWKVLSTGQCFFPSQPKFLRATVWKSLIEFSSGLQYVYPDTPEFSFVSQKLSSPIISRISTILKVNNPSAQARFETEKQSLFNHRGGCINLRYGWHGTAFHCIKGILRNNFVVFDSPTNGHSFGKGIYFASERRAHVSERYCHSDDNGEKHLFLCQLLCGIMEKSYSRMSGPSNSLFDSGTDDVYNPTMHIMWACHIPRILIEYIVTFAA